MPSATRLSTDMGHWADGTRHYRGDDGMNFAVEATLIGKGDHVIPVGAKPMINELLKVVGNGRAALKTVVRPTVVFACAEDGAAVDLTPLRVFPPCTSHKDALAEMGYTVGG